jgi:hypothetical protein
MPMIRGVAINKPNWVSLKDDASAATRLSRGTCVHFECRIRNQY